VKNKSKCVHQPKEVNIKQNPKPKRNRTERTKRRFNEEKKSEGVRTQAGSPPGPGRKKERKRAVETDDREWLLGLILKSRRPRKGKEKEAKKTKGEEEPAQAERQEEPRKRRRVGNVSLISSRA